MKGSSLLFMVLSWMVVFGFVVFCFTVILREDKKQTKVDNRESFDFENEEIT
ncbi:hypothetical protein SAMN06265339_1528 [Desulfurobacterium pacificum]|uniref:Uncharacterized protein n=1 Tax=Desulfurobacterium pacificum TaxID=240166 RepID=A0ABY1NUD4_9BACT|nr:hypothetical protein SAMN06265339_1528 [Desulfurobacterium pacificum]